MSSRKTICWAIPAASAFLALIGSRTVFSQRAVPPLPPTFDSRASQVPSESIPGPSASSAPAVELTTAPDGARSGFSYMPPSSTGSQAPKPYISGYISGPAQGVPSVPSTTAPWPTSTTSRLQSPPNAYRYASGVAGPVVTTSPKAVETDPEMVKLVQADWAKTKEAMELVALYKAAAGGEPQAEVRKKLEALVDEHFDLRQQRRELEISRLEARLAQIRASLEKRGEARQLIVDRHIAQLLGEGDDLAF